MPWLREIKWDFNFDCCYEGNTMLSKDAGYSFLVYWEFFLTKPVESIEEWAMKNAETISLDRANYSCAELQAKFSGCQIEVNNLRYTEVLMPGIRIKTTEGVVTVPPRKPLKIELAQLELLENKLAEYGRKLDDLRNNLKGANETILRWKGVTEAEEPNLKTYVKVAKAARTRLRNSIKVQKAIIDRQKKTIEDYKTKIGFVE